MLIRPQLIDRLAETLEGIAVTHPRAGTHPGGAVHEATVLVYHSGTPAASAGTGGHLAGESPLLEIALAEAASGLVTVLVNSALGMIELHHIGEVRLQEATEEAAFYSRQADGTISVLTISSRGVLQVYGNIPEALVDADLAEVSDSDLRAAVALKIFAENAEVFRSEA